MLVDNLVVNAVNYSFDNGVVMCLSRVMRGTALVVASAIEGIGIPREKLPRIFDDYYRTEEAVQHNRGSTGLGLAIVRQVACKDRVPHHGRERSRLGHPVDLDPLERAAIDSARNSTHI